MARDYTPLPFEYLEEMDTLSDAEFGRLVRALLEYSITGQEPELSGGERVHWKRVRNREARYRESFEESEKTMSKRGTKAARARWDNAQACTSMQKDAQACACITSNAKNANTDTDTDTNTDTDTDTKKRKRKEARPRFTPPSLDEVRAYCQERGNGVDPEAFTDFYRSKGWKVGKDPMVDWRSAVRTWERRDGRGRGGAAGDRTPERGETREFHIHYDVE